MKTITITITTDEGLEAEVRGTFPRLPGKGTLEWSMKPKLEAALKAPYAAPLPDYHFAETFVGAIQAMTKHHGWTVESVHRTGDWEVFTE